MAGKETTKKETAEKAATRIYSFRVKREAFNLYLDDVPPREISARLDIPDTTLKSWIAAKDWKSKKESIQAESLANVADQFKNLIDKHQFLTLKRKLRTAALLDKSIQNALVDEHGNMMKLSPERLRDLALAFKSNADVDGKMLGLTQGNQQTLVLAGRGSMVNIGIQGMPVASLPAPGPERELSQADISVSLPAYENIPLSKDGVPF